MAVLTYAQIEGYWVEGGGSAVTAPIAAAVALAESSGNPDAVGPSFGGDSGSIGLWQIQSGAHPQWSVASLHDPLTNAQAAVSISGGGSNWKPWSTFTNGSYGKFLQAGVTPAATASLSSSSPTTNPAAPAAGSNPISTAITAAGADLSSGAIGVGLVALGALAILVGLWLAIKDTGAGQMISSTVGSAVRVAALVPK